MTGDRLPRLLVLDDREGLVRSAPGIDSLRQRCRITALDQPLDGIDDAELADVRLPMAIRERPAELLDPEVVPCDRALGGVLGTPP